MAMNRVERDALRGLIDAAYRAIICMELNRQRTQNVLPNGDPEPESNSERGLRNAVKVAERIMKVSPIVSGIADDIEAQMNKEPQ